MLKLCPASLRSLLLGIAALMYTLYPALVRAEVLATFKPLHSLAAAVAGDRLPVSLLLDGMADPHHVHLHPKQVAKIEAAATLFYFDPTLENFLPRILDGLEAEHKAVAVGEAPGLQRLPLRTPGAWGEHDEHEEHDEHDEHEHHNEHTAHSHSDPHFWLDIGNAIHITRFIAHTLGKRHPEHADYFQQRAAAFAQSLRVLDAQIGEQLQAFAGRAFLVHHDAYQYFTRRYGLSAVGALTDGHDVGLSVRGKRHLHATLEALPAGPLCLFYPPAGNTPPKLPPLPAQLEVKAAALDPIGYDLAAGEALYPEMLRRMAAGLRGCFAAG